MPRLRRSRPRGPTRPSKRKLVPATGSAEAIASLLAQREQLRRVYVPVLLAVWLPTVAIVAWRLLGAEASVPRPIGIVLLLAACLAGLAALWWQPALLRSGDLQVVTVGEVREPFLECSMDAGSTSDIVVAVRWEPRFTAPLRGTRALVRTGAGGRLEVLLLDARVALQHGLTIAAEDPDPSS